MLVAAAVLSRRSCTGDRALRSGKNTKQNENSFEVYHIAYIQKWAKDEVLTNEIKGKKGDKLAGCVIIS